DVAQELNRSKPASGPEAMRKLNVLLRAGLWSEAMKAVEQLHAVCSGLAHNAIQSIFHTACDEFEAWEVARQLVEVFADNIQELPLESRLLPQFTAWGSRVDAIEEWLGPPPGGRG